MIVLSELLSNDSLDLCCEGVQEFRDLFGESASYEDTFSQLSPSHSVSFIIQLYKAGSCPDFILKAVPELKSLDRKNRFPTILGDWNRIRSLIINGAPD